jgi:hypothetical protein
MRKRSLVAALIVAIACSGGLSKSSAAELLKSYYSKEEVVNELALGIYSILVPPDEVERNTTVLFNKYCNDSDVKAAIAQGLVSLTFLESTANDFYHEWDLRYRLLLTEKGSSFERSHDEGTMKRIYSLKVADYVVDEVTGVVVEKNNAKIYYTVSFRSTPFAAITPPRNVDLQAHNQPMTAIAISDGKNWHVDHVLKGTQ